MKPLTPIEKNKLIYLGYGYLFYENNKDNSLRDRYSFSGEKLEIFDIKNYLKKFHNGFKYYETKYYILLYRNDFIININLFGIVKIDLFEYCKLNISIEPNRNNLFFKYKKNDLFIYDYKNGLKFNSEIYFNYDTNNEKIIEKTSDNNISKIINHDNLFNFNYRNNKIYIKHYIDDQHIYDEPLNKTILNYKLIF